MDETVLFPSPNWFQVSGMVVTTDGWVIYGAPRKSLCILEPLPPDYDRVLNETQGFRAHVVPKAHFEKVVSVDVSPEWPTKRSILTGSEDGAVKQWSIELSGKNVKIKSTHSHDVHSQEKEEVVAVGYSTERYSITVGEFGNIVRWDLQSNVVKSFAHFFKHLRPSCVSCSPHALLHVAVGTKQGVVFVLDLNGNGKILYKVRGHDDHVLNVSWCPQTNVIVKRAFSEVEKYETVPVQSSVSSRLEKIRAEAQKEEEQEQIVKLEKSGLRKDLPDDSFDKSQAGGDDMFDIYKDHEADEFGHSKFMPEDVLVKIKPKLETSNNFLVECLKLKEDILNRKVPEPESTIESLVEAMDKTHMDNVKANDLEEELAGTSNKKLPSDGSDHIHKNLLASVSKQGGIRIWSKTGKLIGSCVVPSENKHHKSNKDHKSNKAPQCSTILWYKPDILLIADGKSQLLQCNPLIIDSKNKLYWKVLHSFHKRGLYCIASDVPRVQNDVTTKQTKDWSVWTISQERTLVRYSIDKNAKISTYGTCGGNVYMVQACPYDARKIAVSVGDGAARIWETDTLVEDDSKLKAGSTLMFWQNVQGKVLTVAWHPTRENLLAFSTAESRVGLIDTSKSEKAARVLVPVLSGGVYSLCWGEGNNLYACGGGELVLYNTDRIDEAPKSVLIEIDDAARQVSNIKLHNKMLVCGTMCGGVVIVQDNVPLCSVYIFSKMIHMTEWHPQQTSSCSEDSQYKNLIAVCSLDKSYNIVILEFGEKEDGSKQLSTWKTLSGHKSSVLQLAWNPHKEGLLLSTSQDVTVRVWDISTATCVSVFANHTFSTITAMWSAFPQHSTKVLSGGGDCCLRLWDYRDHAPEDYDPTKHDMPKRERKSKKDKKLGQPALKMQSDEETENNLAAPLENVLKGSKRYLLSNISKQIRLLGPISVRKMLNVYMHKNSIQIELGSGDASENTFEVDFFKMFGSNCEVNELLDKEISLHRSRHNWEPLILLYLFRGDVTAAVEEANSREILCPFIVSLAPNLSHKYWKDVTQLYLAQVERLIAKNEEEKLNEARLFGGIIYRKMATQLSIHDVKGAVATLLEAKLYKEAYILCKTRYMDSIAEEILKQWADACSHGGNIALAAICFIALGDLSRAAAVLGESNDEALLSLATEIAKIAGRNTFAERLVEKQAEIKNKAVENKETLEETLEQLPSRIELLLKNNCDTEAANGNALEASK